MDLRDPVDVLARTVWGEARDQGRGGMAAVAMVVMNRAHHPRWWGHDVISVCLEPAQFSSWNAHDPNRPKMVAVTGADPAFVTALAVASNAVNGKLIDPTNRADSYYATTGLEPSWAHGRTPCAIIGKHRFYRLELPDPSVPVPHVADDADDLNAAELSRIQGTEP